MRMAVLMAIVCSRGLQLAERAFDSDPLRRQEVIEAEHFCVTLHVGTKSQGKLMRGEWCEVLVATNRGVILVEHAVVLNLDQRLYEPRAQ